MKVLACADGLQRDQDAVGTFGSDVGADECTAAWAGVVLHRQVSAGIVVGEEPRDLVPAIRGAMDANVEHERGA
jgi:hypothetical protein